MATTMSLSQTEEVQSSSPGPNFYQKLQSEIQALRFKVDQQLSDMVVVSSNEIKSLSNQLMALQHHQPSMEENPMSPGSLRQLASPRLQPHGPPTVPGGYYHAAPHAIQRAPSQVSGHTSVVSHDLTEPTDNLARHTNRRRRQPWYNPNAPYGYRIDDGHRSVSMSSSVSSLPSVGSSLPSGYRNSGWVSEAPSEMEHLGQIREEEAYIAQTRDVYVPMRPVYHYRAPNRRSAPYRMMPPHRERSDIAKRAAEAYTSSGRDKTDSGIVVTAEAAVPPTSAVPSTEDKLVEVISEESSAHADESTPQHDNTTDEVLVETVLSGSSKPRARRFFPDDDEQEKKEGKDPSVSGNEQPASKKDSKGVLCVDLPLPNAVSDLTPVFSSDQSGTFVHANELNKKKNHLGSYAVKLKKFDPQSERARFTPERTILELVQAAGTRDAPEGSSPRANVSRQDAPDAEGHTTLLPASSSRLSNNYSPTCSVGLLNRHRPDAPSDNEDFAPNESFLMTEESLVGMPQYPVPSALTQGTGLVTTSVPSPTEDYPEVPLPLVEAEDKEQETPDSKEAIEPVECKLVDMENVKEKTIQDPYGDHGVYSGMLLGGRPNGQGKMKYDDGRMYVGQWKHGRWHGHGKTLFSNGDMYTGDYVKDKRHGKGRYEWKDGRIYDGDFDIDHRDGQGCYSFPDGSRYSGTFKAGIRHGKGCYQFADSSVYNGEFRDGKYHGIGECVWADGRCYRGEWYQGQAHGYGVEIRANGTVRHEGEWYKDRPIRDKSNSKGGSFESLTERPSKDKRWKVDNASLHVESRDETEMSRGNALTDKKDVAQSMSDLTQSEAGSCRERPEKSKFVCHDKPDEHKPESDQNTRASKYSFSGGPGKWSKKIRAKKAAALTEKERLASKMTLIRD